MSGSHRMPRSVVSCLIASVVFGLVALMIVPALAQTTQPDVIPNRITQPINPDERVTLQNSVHPLAQARYDQGPAPGSLQTGRIMLVLKRSGVQENALKQYLADLQNPNSPNYRRWLTPVQFGAQYGISDTDLTTVTAWLQSEGFTVEKVPEARNFIIFSGNLAQIQQAFDTTIHRYSVNGEMHLANSTDPQIPAALAPVIAGIAKLNDFRPKRGAVESRTAHFDSETRKIKPDLTLQCNASGACSIPSGTNGNILFAVPADAATIYDTPNATLNGNYSKVSSLLGGKSYDGTGLTIGIVGDANINAQDIAAYRAGFLPSSYSAHPPKVVIDGDDPGINPDSIEALLDLEVSGGIAPGASINLYISADVGLSSGLDFAIIRALADNNVSILNVSFGQCEQSLGSSNETYSQDWEQAAAQGISVTVASGDSGSAGCDDSNSESSAQFGLAVSGFASTAYNIAVGGTDYDVLLNDFATYVNSSNAAASYYRTALSYIPENPWNNSTQPPNSGGYSSNTPFMDSNQSTNITGGGGGVSSCTQTNGIPPNTTCVPNSGYPIPPFQTGAPDFTFKNRAVPDVSLLAANGFYSAIWLVCSDSEINGQTATPTQIDCEQTSGSFTNGTTFTGVGGTSAAAPAFAGMLALVSQSQGGVRLGQADNVLYNLAAQSALYPSVFHDVTAGNNSVVCMANTPNCGANGFLAGYNTGTGYDAASGLGSVDAAQLVANWTKASFTPTTTSFTINGGTSPISVKHGTQLNLAASVSPGAATGDVSFVNNSGVENNQALIGFVTPLSSGKASVSTSDLPGSPQPNKPYNVYAYYGGDVKNAASQSNPVQVTISPESSSVVLGMSMIDPSSSNIQCDDIDQPPTTCKGQTIPYGFATVISAQVKGASGSNTVATGNIVLADTAGSLPALPISSSGAAAYSNYSNPAESLSVAAHGVTASYAGDGSYLASNSGSAYSFTISKGQTTLTLLGSQNQNAPTITLTATVNTDSIGLPPGGAMTFQVGSTTLGTAPAPSKVGFVGSAITAQYEITIPTNATGLVSGNNTITATYPGDTHYSNSNASTVVTVTAPSFTLFGTNVTVAAGATTGNTADVIVEGSGGFSGTVALACAITSSPSGATNLPTCSLNPTSVSLANSTIQESTLTINTTAATTTGAYVVTLTGTSGSVSVKSPLNLTVTPSGAIGSFTINSPALTVVAGASTGNTASMVVTPTNGFTGMVALTCAITTSPAGAMSPPTCSLSPTSVSIDSMTLGASTLTIGTTATTTTGAYVVTVTGTSGSTTAKGTVNLTVSASSSTGSFNVSGTAVTVNAGATTGNTSTVTVTPSGGFLGAVNLKCALTTSPSGAMDLPTCNIPSSVLINGTSAATASMTVSTTAPMSGSLFYPLKDLLRGASGTALACVFMLVAPVRRRAWRTVLGLVAFGIVVSALVGCGGGGGSHTSGGTTTGSYVFTVSASSSNSGGGTNATTTIQVMVN